MAELPYCGDDSDIRIEFVAYLTLCDSSVNVLVAPSMPLSSLTQERYRLCVEAINVVVRGLGNALT